MTLFWLTGDHNAAGDATNGLLFRLLGMEGRKSDARLKDFAPTPPSKKAVYPRWHLEGLIKWAKANDADLCILFDLPPNNDAWRALGGDLSLRKADWKADRLPREWWGEYRAAIQDYIDYAASFSAKAGYSASRITLAAGNEVQTPKRDGKIDAAWHQMMQAVVPLLDRKGTRLFHAPLLCETAGMAQVTADDLKAVWDLYPYLRSLDGIMVNCYPPAFVTGGYVLDGEQQLHPTDTRQPWTPQRCGSFMSALIRNNLAPFRSMFPAVAVGEFALPYGHSGALDPKSWGLAVREVLQAVSAIPGDFAAAYHFRQVPGEDDRYGPILADGAVPSEAWPCFGACGRASPPLSLGASSTFVAL